MNEYFLKNWLADAIANGAHEGFPTLFPPVQSAGEMGEKEGKFSYLFTCKRGKRREIMGGNLFHRFSLEKSREPLEKFSLLLNLMVPYMAYKSLQKKS